MSLNSFWYGTVFVLFFFCSASLINATRSARFLRAALDNPVVRIPTSILPDNGSVADCFNASLCKRHASSTSIISTF